MATPKMERTRHPGVYKRGGRYVAVWQHRGRQHKSFHRTLSEALEAKGARQAGDTRPSTRATFEEYALEWLDTYRGRTSRGLSETTRKEYKRALEDRAIPFYRGWRLADVEPPDVRRYVRHLEESELSPATVVKYLAPLKAMYATAFEDGSVRHNPTSGLRVNGRVAEDEEEPEAKAMTRAELARLLAELPEHWRLFHELLAETGLRVSEALGLDWPDVQFGATPLLRIRRQYYRGTLKRLKSRNGRRDLPLSAGLARRLWTARPANGEGPIFATRNGTRLSDRNVRRVLDKAAERAGQEWVSFHSFRHGAASMLFDSGRNIRQVCDWLGHADPAFTLRTYVHLMDGGLGDPLDLDAELVRARDSDAAEPAEQEAA
jgi:integrase